MAYDIQEKILNKDGAYINILPVSKASLIKTADGETVEEKIIHTYIHTKNGTVHNLQGVGNNIEFLATADFTNEDIITINGNPKVAAIATINGDPISEGFIKKGNWYFCILDGNKLNFIGSKEHVKYANDATHAGSACYADGATIAEEATHADKAKTADYSSRNISRTTPALRNIKMSTSSPSGGSNGDIWFQYK